MRKLHASAMVMGAMLIGAPAFAQTAAPATQPAAPAAQATAPASVSDDEMAKFAKAAIDVDKVRTDTAVADADKQKAMVAKIEANGLTPIRFNEIAQASQTDTALQTRMQTAIAAAQQPAGGTTANAASQPADAGATTPTSPQQ